MVLIAYLRQVKKMEFYENNKERSSAVLLTRVVDLHFELACLKSYHEIINVLLHQVEHKSNLEEDLQILG